MLDISDESRKRLYAGRELTRDHDGDEVFVGLTVSESVFFLENSQRPKSELSDGEMLLFLQITDRHIKARLSNLMEETSLYLAGKL